MGRPSIPCEWLLKAQLLIALYSVRSDRLFCERLNYAIRFRWFLDMNLDEPSWNQTREKLRVRSRNHTFWRAVSSPYPTSDSVTPRVTFPLRDRKSTRLNSSHIQKSRMPSSA